MSISLDLPHDLRDGFLVDMLKDMRDCNVCSLNQCSCDKEIEVPAFAK